jgi:ribosome maturation factor RimP
MISEEYIKSLALQHLEGTDKFLTSVRVRPGNRIMIFMDADSNVSIADCAQLSRFIESNLDRNAEDFDIDVSSAGLDFPLTMERQYRKNIGREVKVVLKNGSVRTGTLTNISGKEIEITETMIEKINKKKEIRKLPVLLVFDQIKETRLVINI